MTGMSETAAVPSHGSSRLFVSLLGVTAFASLCSMVGVAVGSRTLARAAVAIESLEGQEQRLAKMADAIKVAEARAHATAPAGPETGPSASVADVDRAVDRLRGDIAKYNATRGDAVLSDIRLGQSELGNRLAQLAEQLRRVETALSANRKARRADGREQPF